jgi:hypothetical protein
LLILDVDSLEIRTMRARTFLAVFLVMALGAPVLAQAVHQDIFISGKDKYHTFRIPALIATPKGALLAFCEGRKNSASDTGKIDVVLRRSSDSGKSWTPMQVVAADGDNTVGNPCPVVDAKTGTIWLLLTHNLGRDNERGEKKASEKISLARFAARWLEEDVAAEKKP